MPQHLSIDRTWCLPSTHVLREPQSRCFFACLTCRAWCSRCPLGMPSGSDPTQTAHKKMLLCYKLSLQEAVVGVVLWIRQSQDSVNKLLEQEWNTGLLNLNLPTKYYASASCLPSISYSLSSTMMMVLLHQVGDLLVACDLLRRRGRDEAGSRQPAHERLQITMFCHLVSSSLFTSKNTLAVFLKERMYFFSDNKYECQIKKDVSWLGFLNHIGFRKFSELKIVINWDFWDEISHMLAILLFLVICLVYDLENHMTTGSKPMYCSGTLR